MRSTQSTQLRLHQIIWALSGLLIALGVGNVIFGARRAAHYERLIVIAHRETPRLARVVIPLADPNTTITSHERHLRRMRGSFHFYLFVRRAGIVMITAGVALLTIGALFLGPARGKATEA